MTPRFVRKTSLDGLTPLSVDGQPVYQRYAPFRDALVRLVGAERAALFAEPVKGGGGRAAESTESAKADSIAWYGAVAGDLTPLSDLQGPRRAAAETQLRQALEPFGPLLSDPELGRTIGAALHIASLQDVLVGDGGIILTNWGIVPNAAAADGQALAAHFRATLGPFAGFDAPELLPMAKPAAATQPMPPQGPAAPMADSRRTVLAPVPVREPWHRQPWVLPAGIAAALILGVVFGWLIFGRSATVVARAPQSSVPPSDLVAIQRALNKSLEDQLARLKTAMAGNVCTVENPLGLPALSQPLRSLPPGPGGPGLQPQPGPGVPGIQPQQGPGGPVTTPQPGPGIGAPPQPGPVVGPPGPTADPEKKTEEAKPDQPPGPSLKPLPADKPAPATVGDLLTQSTVFVFGVAGQGVGFGTGFFVTEDIVMTNSHVVDEIDPNRIFVINERLGEVHKAQLLTKTGHGKSSPRDFALLRIAGVSGVHPFAITDQVKQLDGVIAAGYPGIVITADMNFKRLMEGDGSAAPNMVATPGAVSVVQKISDDYPLVVHTADVNKGNSGGPLVDRCGRVVGVNTQIRTRTEQVAKINVALPGADVIRYLRENQVPVQTQSDVCAPQ